MPLKNVLPVDTNSINHASNAVCATKCWTQQTAQNTIKNCTARTAMVVNSDQKDTVSVLVLVVCPWTAVPISKLILNISNKWLNDMHDIYPLFFVCSTDKHTQSRSIKSIRRTCIKDLQKIYTNQNQNQKKFKKSKRKQN